ncbi:DUF2255 family protein [Plantactinospora sp. KBS50]|uniref:DUF2255 family protein n=1 Tax=Plantactinospora sp. KBS50 TaxID=2024580 RepID=UPI000BAAFD8D|nr:DUF2255 family protein [Plantactinospora sp. KBS50]ASW56346.1 hypothetical protein CIK06_22605 [Plantactinospora sp. KBS50]
MPWSEDQLRAIASRDDFRIAPFRADGVTPGTLIWVWSAVVDDGVFVRSANPASRWFAAARSQRAGIAESAGARLAVRFDHVLDERLRDRVDEAFAAKYGADPYFAPEILRRSREQIARVTPDSAVTPDFAEVGGS